jgi:hypothetical protein
MAEIIVDPVALAVSIFLVEQFSAPFILRVNPIDAAAFIIIGNM